MDEFILISVWCFNFLKHEREAGGEGVGVGKGSEQLGQHVILNVIRGRI